MTIPTSEHGDAVVRPLTELNSVNWAALQHAYGPAVDVPVLLRRAANNDENITFDLCSFLWHQGTVYSATAHAVPFLLGVLAAGQGRTAELLSVLNLMAHGHGYALVHERDPVRRASPEVQARMRLEQIWVEAARQAVARGALVYRPLLHAPQAEVRQEAARLLAVCAETQPQALAWLAEALAEETDDSVRACMLEAAYREGHGPAVFAALPPDLLPEHCRELACTELRFWVVALTVQAGAAQGKWRSELVQEVLNALHAEDLFVDEVVAALLVPLGERDRVARHILDRPDPLRDPYTFLDLFREELPWTPNHLPALLREFMNRYLGQSGVLISMEDYGLPVFQEDLCVWLAGGESPQRKQQQSL